MLISRFKNTNIKEKVNQFEIELDIKLPKQFKEFLYKYNGGKTPETNFRLNKVSSDLVCFYGLDETEEFCDFYKAKKRDSFKEFIEEGYLLIGYNSFGDYILIGVSEENNGKIYFYYHDRPKKYIEISENFSTFTDKCKSRKIGHIRSIEERKNDMIENGLGDKITNDSIRGWQAEIDEYANIYQEKLTLNEEKDLER